MSKSKNLRQWIRILIPGLLVVVWLACAGFGALYFEKIGGESSNDLTSFLPENAESTLVNERLSKFQDKKSIPLIIVYNDDGRKLTDDDVKAIASVNEEISRVDQVLEKIMPPVQSEDKKAVISVVPLESDGDFKSTFKEIRQVLDGADLAVDYTLTGAASFAHDLQDAFSGIDSTLLIVALAVVFVILLVVYRSPILPFIVLFSAVAALSVAVWLVVELARADIVQLNGQVQGILFILVIGAATDYSLLYIARYREELVEHRSAWQATWAALKSSYEPIIAAGGTVTAGLLCLLLSNLGSNQALGPVGGMGVGLSVLAALTLLPSFLLLLGRRVFWPRIPKYQTSKAEQHYLSNHPVWAHVGRFVQKHPRRLWVGCTILLLAACVGTFQLKADGVSQSSLVLGESEAINGQKIIDRHFSAGSGSPTLVMVDADKRDKAVELIEAEDGVASVAVAVSGLESGSMPVGSAADEIYAKIRNEITKERKKQLDKVRNTIAQQMAGLPEPMQQQAYESSIANMPSVEELVHQSDPFKNAKVKVADDQVLLQVTLDNAADSLVARETVQRLRDDLKRLDSRALVGGTTAIQLDTNRSALRDVKVVMPAILVAITVILMLLLRAIVAPLLLLVTTVMSFGAAIGVSALLFNHVWQFPGADPAVIIFSFVFLVALGIDYNIFLMTRVREETIKRGVNAGTIKGLVVTGGVITSAGIVLAATFSALSVIPILFLVQIAFIVAFGVLLDTIVVRSLLVPSLTLEVGRLMWWPSKIWRNKRRGPH